MDQKAIERAAKYLREASDSLTKEDFLDSFKNVIELVLRIERDLTGKIGTAFSVQNQDIADALKTLEPYKREFQRAINDAMAANDTTFAGVRQRAIESIDGLFNRMRLNERLNTALNEYAAKAIELEQKIAQIPNTAQLAKEAAALVHLLDPIEMRDGLESLPGGQKLAISAIEGLVEALDEIGKRLKKQVQFYAGVGGSTSTSTGTGVTVETPTGTVDAVNVTFTVSAQPQWVVADGTTYYENAGYTYAALTITMSIAPSQYIRAIT